MAWRMLSGGPGGVAGVSSGGGGGGGWRFFFLQLPMWTPLDRIVAKTAGQYRHVRSSGMAWASGWRRAICALAAVRDEKYTRQWGHGTFSLVVTVFTSGWIKGGGGSGGGGGLQYLHVLGVPRSR